MESVLQLELPWRMLRPQLAQMDPDGDIDFMSCFYDLKIDQPIKEVRGKPPPCKSGRNSLWCSLRHKRVVWPIRWTSTAELVPQLPFIVTGGKRELLGYDSSFPAKVDA